MGLTGALMLATPALPAVRGTPPDIDVSPASISRIVSGVDTVPLTIRNLGNMTLVWSETAIGVGTVTVLEQPQNEINGFNTGFYNGQVPPGGVYLSDDATPAQPVVVSSFLAQGFMAGPGTETLPQIALAVTFKIYADAAGVPAGNPEAGPGGEVYSCVRTPTGPGSAGLSFGGVLPDADVTLDLSAAAAGGCPQPPRLEPGQRYWLSVFPTVPGNFFSSRRWATYVATTQSGVLTHRISPTQINGIPPSWTPVIPVTPGTLPAFAYTLIGAPACGASWLDLTPDGDVLGLGGQSDAIVTLDATSLAPGTYQATLCIDTEGTDPDEPKVVVPVTMTVPGDLLLADGFEDP